MSHMFKLFSFLFLKFLKHIDLDNNLKDDISW